MERLITNRRMFAIIIIYILIKAASLCKKRREGILIVLLSPKAQRDAERSWSRLKEFQQIKGENTETRRENSDLR